MTAALPPWIVRIRERTPLWILGFSFSMLLSNLSYGMYLVLSRDLVKTILGNNYGFMTMLVAAETLPLLFSALGGGLADVVGRRTILLISVAGAIPLFLMGVTSIYYLPVLAALYMAMWSLAWPSITGALLHATGSSGRSYGFYMMWATIGWGIGGPLGGVLEQVLGPSATFYLSAIIYALSAIIPYLSFPEHVTGGTARTREVLEGARLALYTFMAGSLVFAGLNLFFGSYALRLRQIAGSSSFFGVVYTLFPAIIGAVARPLVGILSDKIRPVYVALMGTVIEATLMVLLYFAWGWTAILIWLVPAFPFLDQGYTMLLSRRLPGRLQALAAGIRLTMSSLGGAIVLIISFTPVVKSLLTITIASETLIILSCIMLGLSIYARKPYM